MIRNSLWGIADTLSYPLVMVFATPFLLNRIGSEQYGLWMLVNSIVASLGMVNIGGGEAVIRLVAQARGAGDEAGAGRASSLGFSLSLYLALVLFGLGWFLPPIIQAWNLFAIPVGMESTMVVALQWASWLTGLRFVEQVFVAVPKGYERFDLAAFLSIPSRTGLVVVQVLTVSLGGDLVTVFKVATVYLALVLVIEHGLVSRLFPVARARWVGNLVGVGGILHFSLWTWAYSVLGIVSGQLDRFVISSRLSLDTLAWYSIGAMVGTQLHGVFASAVGWVFPRVARASGAGSGLAPLYRKLQWRMVLGGCLILGVLRFSGDLLFGLWLGDNWGNAKLFVELFLAFIALELVTIVPYFFFRSHFIAWSTGFKAISLGANVVSMLLGFKLLGVEGLIYGKMVGATLVGIANRLWMEHRLFNRPLTMSSIGESLAPLLPSLGVALWISCAYLY